MHPAPSLAEVYLAYRQAKMSLWRENTALGNDRLARYEENLDENLTRLQRSLARKKQWFDGLDTGPVCFAPKKLRPAGMSSGTVIAISDLHEETSGGLDVRVLCLPSIDFHVVEVLYLWRFGILLESLIPSSSVGYRLNLRSRHPRLDRTANNLFEFWPRKYRLFRSQPIKAAAKQLRKGFSTGECLLISLDLTSFYDNIDPIFLLSRSFLLDVRGRVEKLAATYEEATRSLLRAIGRYYARCRNVTGISVESGIPIGFLTSRVVANLALANLDRYLSQKSVVHCYLRYVDDIVLVADPVGDARAGKHVLEQLLPCKATLSDAIELDEEMLGRSGSRFIIQPSKSKVFYLQGTSGLEFLTSIGREFEKLSSERRALGDPRILRQIQNLSMVSARASTVSRLRFLRDADRTRLEKFALGSALNTLARASTMLDKVEARNVFIKAVSPLLRALYADGEWVENLDTLLRILQLSVLNGADVVAAKIIECLDAAWKRYAQTAENYELYWNGRKLRKRAHTRLRDYLHERRISAICAALPIGKRADAKWLRSGVQYKTKIVSVLALRKRAVRLARTDLRTLDREEQVAHGDVHVPFAHESLRRRLGQHDDLLFRRFERIGKFASMCERDLGDKSWSGCPVALFLCTRPPSYFDISRRRLYKADNHRLTSSLFKSVLMTVNAFRGTRYRLPNARVIDASTVELLVNDVHSEAQLDPKLIMGNLILDDRWHDESLKKGQGRRLGSAHRGCTAERLARLSELLEQAERIAATNNVAARPRSLLVLPELALPRAWTRQVAHHVVKNNLLSLISGLEYHHHPTKPYVYNQVIGIFSGPFASATAWLWTKRRPADHERSICSKKKLGFAPPPSPSRPRTVISSGFGRISVLVCSELLEARLVGQLLGRAEVVIVPSWNPDTASYDHLVQSVGLQLHAVIAIANNARYSDCRVWAPYKERWRRDLCRLVQRSSDGVVDVQIPLQELRKFRQRKQPIAKIWKPLPPDFP